MMWLFTYFSHAAFMPSPAHRSLLAVAKGEIGKGESGANNSGAAVAKYRNGGKGKGPWCAAFVSWCIEHSDVAGKVKRSHGAKRLFRRVVRAGAFTDDDPLPGDIVCWHRGKKGSWKGHIGIVSRVEGSTFWAIEGNRGRFPSKVAEYRHELDEAMLIGFARVR